MRFSFQSTISGLIGAACYQELHYTLQVQLKVIFIRCFSKKSFMLKVTKAVTALGHIISSISLVLKQLV